MVKNTTLVISCINTDSWLLQILLPAIFTFVLLAVFTLGYRYLNAPFFTVKVGDYTYAIKLNVTIVIICQTMIIKDVIRNHINLICIPV